MDWWLVFCRLQGGQLTRKGGATQAARHGIRRHPESHRPPFGASESFITQVLPVPLAPDVFPRLFSFFQNLGRLGCGTWVVSRLCIPGATSSLAAKCRGGASLVFLATPCAIFSPLEWCRGGGHVMPRMMMVGGMDEPFFSQSGVGGALTRGCMRQQHRQLHRQLIIRRRCPNIRH